MCNIEWFIAMLFPHIWVPLMQQNIESQKEALELEMKLKSLSIDDGAAGIVQIQSQLANLTIQIQDIKKGKDT